ncbi:MAG: hypothetical protein J6K42_01365 [Clostridia bacterium]|nr:hypothetical protein [Clostridia bacterium]
MFFKVLSRFKDNRTKLIIILVIIGLIVVFIKSMDKYLLEERSNSSSSNYTTAITKKEDNQLEIETMPVSNNSDTNNVKFKDSSINNAEKAVSVFAYYCNNGQIEYAYNMLTDDCKELLYPTQEQFYKNYYQRIFSDEKQCNYTKYADKENIYRIIFESDPLTTGKVNSDDNVIEYITAVEHNGTYKLNISGLIKKENLSIKNSNKYLEAEIINKITYMDYELYTVKIKNTTLVNMFLSSMIGNNEIYLQDDDGNKFFIANEEYTQDDVTIKYRSESTVQLKFNKKYITGDKKIKKIIFNNIRLVNRKYYDNTISKQVDDNTIIYEDKMTTYNSNFKFEINM